MDEKTLYRIALTMVPGIGDVLAKKLVAACGSPEEIFKAPQKTLKRVPRISEKLAGSFTSKEILRRAESECAFLDKYRIKPLYFQDSEYPTRLKNCIDSPVLIYYKGSENLNAQKVISLVGTRKATDYGREMCYQIISAFRDEQVLIVSGLAHGIDSFAHKTALDNGLPTVGVLGHGLDRIYPFQNKKLAERMVYQGGLLTDFPSLTKPDKENFPKRNRIIAGMSDAVIVVEAAIKGGALITADIANSYNRDVFAIPGRVGDTYSAGANALIKQNKAALVQSADDIRYMMGWGDTPSPGSGKQKTIFIELTPEEEKIVGCLTSKGEITIDEIMLETEMSMSKCSAALLNLEFEGVVTSKPGRVYSLC
jgi:DNA processing protein